MNGNSQPRQKSWLWQVLLLAAVFSLLINACNPQATETPTAGLKLCDMFMFDDLTLPGTYVVGDVITSQGHQFVVQNFVWSNGTPTASGHALSEDHNGDIGIFTNNVKLNFLLVNPIDGLTLLVEYHGGNSNILINGDFQNFGIPSDINGVILGGVTISALDLGNSAWQIDFSGTIEELAIGGQEFWIGDMCFGETVK